MSEVTNDLLPIANPIAVTETVKLDDEDRTAKEAIIDAFFIIANHYRINISKERVRTDNLWQNSETPNAFLHDLARQMGLSLTITQFSKRQLDALRLPLVIQLEDESIAVIETVDKHKNSSIRISGENGLQQLNYKTLKSRVKSVWILRPVSSVPDARVDEYIKPYKSNWFKKIIFHDKQRFVDLFLASLLANFLAISTTIFSMQIYDRVVPSKSYSTLWVLFSGVVLAILFEFLLRTARTHLSDTIGKRADSRITDLVFGKALRIKTQAKSQSTGSFTAQIRELEQVRDLITSTTLSALLDLPFILIFFVVLWMIGDMLIIVPIVVIPLLIIAGLIAQWPLAKLSQEGMRESALRNAMLVEAVEALDDIKLLRAEQRFQNMWNQVNDVSSDISKKQRRITHFLTHWTQTLQSLTFVGVLLIGAYLVMDGKLTTGALVATSILSSRMIGPIAQWTGVFARLQNAKVAYTGLNELMQRPVDQALEEHRLQRPSLRGEYLLENITFKYNPEATQPILTIPKMYIPAGAKVGIIGKMGSGKSTLLDLLSGLVEPTEGSLMIDNDLLKMVDVADVRRDIGYVTQQARLFHGTLRENICMGRPQATSEEIMKSLHLSGAAILPRQLEGGLDYMIREGGLGLSGGQKQAILLARILIMQPQILLLDEPTASMDQATEEQVVNDLGEWFGDKTVIVATHRPAVLDWVDTLIVIDNGKVILMGDKVAVLQRLEANSK